MKKWVLLTCFVASFLSAMDSNPVEEVHSDIHRMNVHFSSKAWQKPFIFIDRHTQWMDNVYEYSLSDIPGIHYGCKKFPRFMRFIAGSCMVVVCGFAFNKLVRSRK